jgi:phosphate:Na+ symporter
VVATGIIQYPSAVVGILQSVASSMGIRFCAVFAVILGVNIGDCITTYLVCRIGAKPDQIRTCMVHIIYNVFALALISVSLIILRTTGILNDGIWYMTLNSGGVANVHGLFRLIPAVVLLPFTNLFANIAETIVPQKEEESEEVFRQLDERLKSNPALAMSEAQELIANMGEKSMENYKAAASLAFNYDDQLVQEIRKRENTIDRMADAANNYIVDLSSNIVLEEDENNQNFQLKSIICFERIGDLSVNIMEAVGRVHMDGKQYSESARKELSAAAKAVEDVFRLTVKAYKEDSVELAKEIEPTEEVIDELIDELKERHLFRIRRNLCDSAAALSFQEVLQNLERISDQCSDLGVYLLAKHDNYIRGMEHRYIHNLHHAQEEEYMNSFRTNYQKYFSLLDENPAEEEADASASA